MNSHAKLVTVALLGPTCLLLYLPARGELTLVRDGQAAASVVVSAQATAAQRFAAGQLTRYVEQISAATLPVANTAEAQKGSRVFVGTLERLDEFKISTPKPQLRMEGFVIRTIGDDLLLAGRSDLGTVFAVYQLP